MNRIIANSVPFMPKPLVGRIGRRYAAGEEIEDATRVVEGLATEEGYTHERLAEYKRALDALDKQA